ncbi:hypothetical protein GVAV_002611 [Gurleya vavrai]
MILLLLTLNSILQSIPECDDSCMENLALARAFNELNKIVDDAGVDDEARKEYLSYVNRLKPNIVYENICKDENLLNEAIQLEIKDNEKEIKNTRTANSNDQKQIYDMMKEFLTVQNNKNLQICTTTNQPPVIITTILPPKTIIVTSTILNKNLNEQNIKKTNLMPIINITKENNSNNQIKTCVNSIQKDITKTTNLPLKSVDPIITSTVFITKLISQPTTCQYDSKSIAIKPLKTIQSSLKSHKLTSTARPVFKLPIITYTSSIFSTITSNIPTTVVQTSFIQQPIYYPPQILTQTVTMPNPSSLMINDIKNFISNAVKKEPKTVYLSQPYNNYFELLYNQQKGEISKLSGELNHVYELIKNGASFRKKEECIVNNNQITSKPNDVIKICKDTDKKKDDDCNRKIKKYNVTINKGCKSHEEICKLKKEADCENKKNACKKCKEKNGKDKPSICCKKNDKNHCNKDSKDKDYDDKINKKDKSDENSEDDRDIKDEKCENLEEDTEDAEDCSKRIEKSIDDKENETIEKSDKEEKSIIKHTEKEKKSIDENSFSNENENTAKKEDNKQKEKSMLGNKEKNNKIASGEKIYEDEKSNSEKIKENNYEFKNQNEDKPFSSSKNSEILTENNYQSENQKDYKTVSSSKNLESITYNSINKFTSSKPKTQTLSSSKGLKTLSESNFNFKESKLSSPSNELANKFKQLKIPKKSLEKYLLLLNQSGTETHISLTSSSYLKSLHSTNFSDTHNETTFVINSEPQMDNIVNLYDLLQEKDNKEDPQAEIGNAVTLQQIKESEIDKPEEKEEIEYFYLSDLFDNDSGS